MAILFIVNSVCFSPDGNTLASGCSDQSIRLWDDKTEQQKSKLDGHDEAVISVCFSPDGNILASGSNDNSIRLWDIKTGKEICPSDTNYQGLLANFKTPLFINNSVQDVNANITILLISQYPILQVQGAFILQGEFLTQGVDLRSFLQSKGGYIIDN